MTTDLTNPARRAHLAAFYREHGGIITALDRDGSVLDTDKSV